MGRSQIIVLSVVVVAALLGVAVMVAGFGPLGLWTGVVAGAESVGHRGEIDGTVSGVDAASQVVRVARGILDFSSTEITVTNDTQVKVEGKIGAFADLREGLSLSVCYDVLPSGRQARAIEAPASPAPCRAVAAFPAAEPPREEPVRPAAAAAEPPAAKPVPALSSPQPTLPRPAILERPAPAAPPIAVRPPAPPKAVASPKVVAPPVPVPARARPAESVSTTPPADPAPPRRTAPAQSGGEDYGAVIDHILRR